MYTHTYIYIYIYIYVYVHMYIYGPLDLEGSAARGQADIAARGLQGRRK